MSSPDSRIVNEMAEEVDFLSIRVLVQVMERVSIADHDVSSSGSKEASGSDSEFPHIQRLKIFKAIKQRLNHRDGLKWYEVAGSYLNHSRG